MSLSRLAIFTAVCGLVCLTPAGIPAHLASAHGSALVQVPAVAVNTRALLHDPRYAAYRSPFGAVPAGTPVTLRLRTAHGGASTVTLQYQQTESHAAGRVKLRLGHRDRKYDVWVGTFTPKDVAVYTYDFLVQVGRMKLWYSDSAVDENTAGTVYNRSPSQLFHLTSFDPAFKTPSWAPNAVYYQIFPDSFFNGDRSNDTKVMAPLGGNPQPTFYSSESDVPQGQFGFYGGDLQGIDDKLPYLKDLGVNTLYLNPIFLATTNHKYDTGDYYTIDPHFGTMQTLQTLLGDAHTAGMRVILDGVFNHTGSDSVYFNQYNRFPSVGAYGSKSSPYYPWYTFTSWPDSPITFPNASDLPQLNESNAVKDFIFRSPDSVAQHWLAAGTDGWRLDAATFKSHQWWQAFRASIKSRFPEDALVCECDASPIDAVPYLMGNEFDGDMNYRFRDIVLHFFARGADSQGGFPTTAAGFFNEAMAMVQEYPLPALYASMNLVDSHDTGRILSSLQGNKPELKQVAAFQATWLGAPSIYYGDEIGMNNAASPDPFYASRQFYDWSHPDTDVQSFYRSVLHIRQANPALRDGTITPLLVDNGSRIVSYLRRDDKQSVVVVFNDGPAQKRITIAVPGLRDGTVLTDALTSETYTRKKGTFLMRLPATHVAILTQAPATVRTKGS